MYIHHWQKSYYFLYTLYYFWKIFIFNSDLCIVKQFHLDIENKIPSEHSLLININKKGITIFSSTPTRLINSEQCLHYLKFFSEVGKELPIKYFSKTCYTLLRVKNWNTKISIFSAFVHRSYSFFLTPYKVFLIRYITCTYKIQLKIYSIKLFPHWFK